MSPRSAAMPGQLALDLDELDGTARDAAVVEGTASLILWEVLNRVYDDLGFDRIDLPVPGLVRRTCRGRRIIDHVSGGAGLRR
jgi:hypothetical protein